MSEQRSALAEWQDTYDWAYKYPDDTQMDGEWWWHACVKNVLAKAFRGTSGIINSPGVVITSPTPKHEWKDAMLTELYGMLYREYGSPTLTIGQFKSVLEKVKPEEGA